MLSPTQFTAFIEASVPFITGARNKMVVMESLVETVEKAFDGKAITFELRTAAMHYLDAVAVASISEDPIPVWKSPE